MQDSSRGDRWVMATCISLCKLVILDLAIIWKDAMENKSPTLGPLTLRTEVQQWRLVSPFRITGYTFESVDVLVLSLEMGGHVGQGEASGVYYRAENPASMLKQLEPLRATIEAGISRDALQKLLGPGGARNALDCALWDLEAKVTGNPAWKIAELQSAQTVTHHFHLRRG